jgi:hypothetical protein
MQRSGKDFTIVKLLPPGVYQVSRQRQGCECDRHVRACVATLPFLQDVLTSQLQLSGSHVLYKVASLL